MKYIGHTMAVPGMRIVDAIKLFSEIGLDGIELVAQEGTPFHIDLSPGIIEEIIVASKNYGLPIVTLTPYFWGINSMDESERRANISGLVKTISLAKKMGAKFVRAYGGKELAGDTPQRGFNATVAALKEAGKAANDAGIVLLVENHPGTMTRTGTDTRKVINAVGMESVRALYDPANVLNDTAEDWLTTLDVQKETIGYIHCKDFRVQDGKRIACVVGEGIVPWMDIIDRLDSKDYFISFEYEKRWYPDQLEDAVTGLPRCIEHIRRALRCE